MKKILIAGLIALSAVGLAGCSSVERPAPVETIPTLAPEDDPNGWDQSVTIDQFVDAFPEFDTHALVAIEGITVQNKARAWQLGSSSTDGSYEKALEWAKRYVALKAQKDTLSGTYVGKKRSISITIRQVGDDIDTSGFRLFITSSV